MTAFAFVHGWATDCAAWNGAAKAIAGANFLNINLPGHGGRGAWDGPDFAPAVREVVRHTENLPEGSVIGVGWSLGAQALLSLVGDERLKRFSPFKGLNPLRGISPFKGLVLAGATPRFTNCADWTLGQPRALVRRMIQDMKKNPEGTLKRFYGLNFTPDELKTPQAVAFINRYKYPGPIECVDAAPLRAPGCYPTFNYADITVALEALYREDLRDALAGVRVPCLIVHGDKDAICPVEAGRFLAQNISGARLEIFNDCGHAPFLTQRERFTGLVKEFAARL